MKGFVFQETSLGLRRKESHTGRGAVTNGMALLTKKCRKRARHGFITRNMNDCGVEAFGGRAPGRLSLTAKVRLVFFPSRDMRPQ